MKKRSWLIVSLVVLLVAVAGGGLWWQHAGAAQAVALASLPPLPDLTTVHPQLRERLAAADARARSRRGPTEGLAELARLYHANGFLDEARRCYEGLEKLQPAEPRWPHRHATILAGFGELDPAITLWQRVIALAPDYLPARLRLAESLLKSNHPAEATAAYDAVLARAPQNAYAQLGLARLDFEAQRWDQARTRLESVVAETNYELGYDLIVSLYEKTGQPERAAAIRATRKASGAYRDLPDPWMDELLDDCFDSYRISIAAGLLSRTAFARSRQLLLRAIELSPDDVSLHFQLATASMENDDPTTAREQLELCTRIAPAFSDGWAQLSGLYTRMGDADSAHRTLSAGLQACPQSPGLHLMRARELQAAGLDDEAIAEFRTSIRLRPNEPDAYHDLGNLLIHLGRNEEGIAQMRTAVEVEPGDPVALGVLAFYSVLVGDEPAARQWLARLHDQPRAPADQVAKILAAYRRQFGHDWQP